MSKTVRFSLIPVLLLAFAANNVGAQSAAPLPGTHTAVSAYAFDTLAFSEALAVADTE